jgi:hypothetical protein
MFFVFSFRNPAPIVTGLVWDLGSFAVALPTRMQQLRSAPYPRGVITPPLALKPAPAQ